MRKFIVTIEGNQYEVGVEEILTDGATVTPVVQEVKPQPQVQAQPKPLATNVSGTKMEAPMPGMIKAYKVAEGATVKKGDVVLVLEAMKMDNDITAPCDGTVSFCVAKGANVESDSVLAVIS